MLAISCRIHMRLMSLTDRVTKRIERGQEGQATAEYALVLLLAAVIAFVVTKYFSKSGDSNPITSIVGAGLGKIWGLAKHFIPFMD